MSTATLTSKGQVTIPAEIRAALGLETGDRLEFVATATGTIEILPVTGTIKALKGIVPAPATPVSVEDMNATIAERGARSR